MDVIISTEWEFSPSNYFEERVVIEWDTYTIVIDNGKVEARIDASVYNLDSKTLDKFHDEVNSRFLGMQVVTHKSFTLSKPVHLYKLYSDGRRDVTVFPQPAVVTASAAIGGVVITDKNGNIISDSRRESLEHKKRVAELVTKHHQDQTLKLILLSYDRAVNYPDTELVHLYEIRDTLKQVFGSEKKAREALSINKKDWSSLGKLANDEPLHQGRHVGEKAVEELRDATASELEEARRIARGMFETYLNYLENQNHDS